MARTIKKCLSQRPFPLLPFNLNTLYILQKVRQSRQDFFPTSDFEPVIVALVSFSVLMWPHILSMLIFMLMGAGPDSLSAENTRYCKFFRSQLVCKVQEAFTFLIKRF